MSNLTIAIGISGAGKSTYYGKHYADTHTRICPDEYRKQLTGDISNQAKNQEVFSMVFKNLKHTLRYNNVYYDATNLSKKSLREICEKAIEQDELDSINFLIFEDSYLWEKCRDRVKKDLLNGVDRSNTDIANDEGKPLIFQMYLKFQQFMELDNPNGFYNFIGDFTAMSFRRGNLQNSFTIGVKKIREGDDIQN